MKLRTLTAVVAVILASCRLPDPVAETGDLSDYLDSNLASGHIEDFQAASVGSVTGSGQPTTSGPGPVTSDNSGEAGGSDTATATATTEDGSSTGGTASTSTTGTASTEIDFE